MCTVIDKLIKITHELPDKLTLEDLVVRSDNGTTYRTNKDKSGKKERIRTKSLYSTEDIAVALTNIKKGEEFPAHSHKAPVRAEFVFMVEGQLDLRIEGKVKQLFKHDFEIIPRDKQHSAVAMSDVVLVAVTIPRDDGFPL